MRRLKPNNDSLLDRGDNSFRFRKSLIIGASLESGWEPLVLLLSAIQSPLKACGNPLADFYQIQQIGNF